MERPIAKGLTAFSVVIGFLALVTLIAVLRRPAPAPPLPTPNGYDDLIQAGRSLAGDFSDVRLLDLAQLKALVTTNAEPLKLAKTGLSRECRVPLTASETAIGDHVKDVGNLKRLAWAFSAQGRLAELDNRPSDAAEAYLDTLRLGHQATRGGLVIDALVGIAVEAIGAARLEQLIPHLDTNDCLKVAAALEQLENRRASPEQILKQEREWTLRCYGFRGQIIQLASFKSLRKMQQNCISKINGQAVRARLLLVAAAARAYELQHGRRPSSLAELVPNYLKSVPLDPATHTNLQYRP